MKDGCHKDIYATNEIEYAKYHLLGRPLICIILEYTMACLIWILLHPREITQELSRSLHFVSTISFTLTTLGNAPIPGRAAQNSWYKALCCDTRKCSEREVTWEVFTHRQATFSARLLFWNCDPILDVPSLETKNFVI